MYYKVKILIKLLNGTTNRLFRKVMTEPEMERLLCHDTWNDGKTKSVTVYVDGEFFANWKLSRPIS